MQFSPSDSPGTLVLIHTKFHILCPRGPRWTLSTSLPVSSAISRLLFTFHILCPRGPRWTLSTSLPVSSSISRLLFAQSSLCCFTQAFVCAVSFIVLHSSSVLTIFSSASLRSVLLTFDEGGGKCDSQRLSVCLLARLLKNTYMDLDEILRVDRCRDMDELINF